MHRFQLCVARELSGAPHEVDRVGVAVDCLKSFWPSAVGVCVQGADQRWQTDRQHEGGHSLAAVAPCRRRKAGPAIPSVVGALVA